MLINNSTPDVASALIGYSGFVGGSLLSSGGFSALFNSSNITAIAGKSYDLVVCAGVSAAKWLANKDPEGDRRAIARLTAALERVKAREFILISTVDVYPDVSAKADEHVVVDPAINHAYGANRYLLEEWVKAHFPLTRIIRLPALFGAGLRKNALYDLLNRQATELINPAAEFQWYPVRRLRADIQLMREADLRLANLPGAPVAMRMILDAFFPNIQVGPESEPAPRYDVCTGHAAVFGGRGDYIIDETLTLGELAQFVAAERHRSQSGN